MRSVHFFYHKSTQSSQRRSVGASLFLSAQRRSVGASLFLSSQRPSVGASLFLSTQSVGFIFNILEECAKV